MRLGMSKRVGTSPGADKRPLGYRVHDACYMLSVGKTKIFAMLASGELQGKKIGGVRLITHESLLACFENAEDFKPSAPPK